jgi:hypothetical protein
MKKEAPENEASNFSHGLLAAVSPKSHQILLSGGRDSGVLPLKSSPERQDKCRA